MPAYILVTPDHTKFWRGPGFVPLARLGREGDRLPLWQDRASAQLAADALKRVLGIDARPLAVRLAAPK